MYHLIKYFFLIFTFHLWRNVFGNVWWPTCTGFTIFISLHWYLTCMAYLNSGANLQFAILIKNLRWFTQLKRRQWINRLKFTFHILYIRLHLKLNENHFAVKIQIFSWLMSELYSFKLWFLIGVGNLLWAAIPEATSFWMFRKMNWISALWGRFLNGLFESMWVTNELWRKESLSE